MQEWKFRNGKTSSPNCPTCGEIDDIVYDLTACTDIMNDPDVQVRQRRLEESWERLGIAPRNCTERAAVILNPLPHVQTTHENRLVDVILRSRLLVQSIWYKKEQLEYDRKTANTKESHHPNKPEECRPPPSDEGQGGETKGKSNNNTITRYFKPLHQILDKGYYAEDPNTLACDQLILGIMNPTYGMIIGVVTTTHGRIVLWRIVLDEESSQQSSLDWSKNLTLLSDDTELQSHSHQDTEQEECCQANIHGNLHLLAEES